MTQFATTRHLLAAFLLLMLPALGQAQSVHDTGTVELEVFANGFVGTTPTDYAETGFTFDGDPGLFHGSFVVGVSESQVSGNYYGAGTTPATVEYSQVSGPTALVKPFAAPFEDFDQGFEAIFDDSAAPNPIGIQVTQRSYSRSDFQNDGFVIVEYTIENTSGADLADVYVGMFADWDVGNFQQNLGSYDDDTRLLYIFDDSETSTNYFGVAALGKVPVSGISYDALGGAETDVEIFQFLTTQSPEPPIVDDRRATLGVGPYDITDGEAIVVRFAFVGGADEDGVIANAAAAQALGIDPMPVDEAIHMTDNVSFEVFDNGSLGSFADAAGASNETGFVFDGDNGLYEGEFLIGASLTQVSGDAYEFPDIEWAPVDPLFVASPPDGADQAFTASYSDAAAANPIGVTVEQFSYSGTDDDYVTVEFTVTNTSGADLEDLYMGIFADWDVGNFEQNLGAYDEDNRLLYVFDDSETSTNYFGQVAIGSDDDIPVSGVFYDALPGDETLFQGLTTISPDPSIVADRRTVLGVGPVDIMMGESVTVAFAFVGGASEEEVIANACRAQGGDDATCNPVATEETTPAGTFVLHSAYPNPFASMTTLGFTLPETQQVRLTVYDVLGRRVATLADGMYAAGYNSVRFDASNLPGGVYIYRLETGTIDLTERVSLVR